MKTPTRNLLSVAALAALVTLAIGSEESDDAQTFVEPVGETEPLQVDDDMARFVEAFAGDKETVMEAVSSRAADPSTIFDDSEHMVGVPYLDELKNTRVVERKEGDGGPCYAVVGDEFPERPDDHTLHKFKVCWSDGAIVHVEELPYFAGL